VSRMTPRRILFGAWLVSMLYAYPGLLKTDGEDMLTDSRSDRITDWHSPIMTEIWRIVGVFVNGPSGMLALQSGLLLFGAFYLLRRTMSERSAAIVAAGVLLFPPLLATSAVVAPQTQLAAFLVAAMAALASEQRRIQILGLGLATIACAMCDGAAIALLPIVIAMFVWRPRRRFAIAAVTWLAIVIATIGLDRLLVDEWWERNEVALANSDITGTLRSARDLDDAYVKSLLGDAPLATTTAIQKRARDRSGSLFEVARNEAEREALLSAHWRVARALPRAYLDHRWHIVGRLLGLAKPREVLYTDFVANSEHRIRIRQAAKHSLVQTILMAPVRWAAKTFLFMPYVYVILALVLLPLAIVRKHREATALLVSGLLYEITLSIESYHAELRDSHWMVLATVLAIAMLVAQGWRASKTRHERVLEQAPATIADDDRG
jgi:hypothetical protein